MQWEMDKAMLQKQVEYEETPGTVVTEHFIIYKNSHQILSYKSLVTFHNTEGEYLIG